jgi:hypothetical protein
LMRFIAALLVATVVDIVLVGIGVFFSVVGV